MNRRKTALVLTLLTLPLLAAYAGGWATITVENLPEYLVAREAANLTFSVRQHGIDLIRDIQPVIEARSDAGEYKARAVPSNRAGYYTAKLDLPHTGDWTITIRSGFGKSNLTLLPIPVVQAGTRPVALDASRRGQRLFVAKGCVTCHVHDRTPGPESVGAGPNLTAARFTGDYLSRFLADPSIKTNWASGERMPNLGLESADVAALVAFLTAVSPQRQAAQ